MVMGNGIKVIGEEGATNLQMNVPTSDKQTGKNFLLTMRKWLRKSSDDDDKTRYIPSLLELYTLPVSPLGR